MLPLIGALGAAAIGGGLSFMGGQQANAANAREAEKNRQFQADMSNTSYQRATADMKAAGLNPALAYQQGGSSTPTGSTAQHQNTLAGAGGTAEGAAKTYNSIKQTSAQVAQARATEKLTSAQAAQLTIESAARLQEMEARARLLSSDANMAQTTFGERSMTPRLQNREIEERTANVQQQTARSIRSDSVWIEQLRAELRNTLAHAGESEARTTLLNLEQPHAQAEAGVNRTWYGKNVRPILRDAATAARIRR
jgi:hypothetical protein